MNDQSATPPSVFALAWRPTLRDFRAGALRLLALAVLLAVAALTAVGFFADRLNTGLARDASDRSIRCIRLFQDTTGWAPHYVDEPVNERYTALCLGPAYVPAAVEFDSVVKV